MVQRRNVLRVNPVEEAASYRAAVAEILRNIQKDEELTLLEISDVIGVSLGTMSNAANKKTDLNPVFLNRLGKAFGPHVLEPYARLCGGCIVAAADPNHSDVLPLILSAGTQIAQARDPQSPGGITETLRERLGYLPTLRRLRREIDALVTSIEAEKAQVAA